MRGSKRTASGSRTRTGNAAVEQPQVGRHVTEPRVGELRRHLLDREPEAAGRHGIDLPGDLGIALLHADDVDDAVESCSSSSSTGSASSASRSGSSPKILTSIGVGTALEVAEHVLQELDELDLRERARLP